MLLPKSRNLIFYLFKYLKLPWYLTTQLRYFLAEEGTITQISAKMLSWTHCVSWRIVLVYAPCFLKVCLICKTCFPDFKKIQSFARMNEWKEKERSKWLSKVHLKTKLNFAHGLVILTINLIKRVQLVRQVRVCEFY